MANLYPLNREDIRIRDPFILTDVENGCYYMYGTTALKEGSLAARDTFTMYKTEDLEHFSEGIVVFDGAATGFWANRDFWAPEVHIYKGRYYLFGSVKAEGRHRATHIFVSDTPEGPFVPVSADPPTPLDWDCLDGTFLLYEGKPYMVFCHEWVQVGDGEMCAIELSDDLTHAVGEPIFLFHASDNPDVEHMRNRPGFFVTDGPFFCESKNGEALRMIWSSHGLGRYLVLEATADKLEGPWTQVRSRFELDGGHAMLFTHLDGRRMIALHAPNKAGLERANFFEYN